MTVQPRITIVTVTFGRRSALVEQLLQAVTPSPLVGRVIVVENGSKEPISLLPIAKSEKVRIVPLESNRGSAVGYAHGLRASLDEPFPFVFLIDDDNLISSIDLERLLRELEVRTQPQSSSRPIVAARRGDRSAPTGGHRRSSFLGFHFADIPQKLKRVLSKSRAEKFPETVALDYCAYGGILLHRDTIRDVGFPREDFVLYSDDHEYTFRCRAAGYDIILINSVLVYDSQPSWDSGKVAGNGITSRLTEGAEFRVYYSIRNRVWMEYHQLPKGGLIYNLNTYFYLACILLVSLVTGRLARWRLICEAVAHGRSAKLGFNPAYPLPG